MTDPAITDPEGDPMARHDGSARFERIQRDALQQHLDALSSHIMVLNAGVEWRPLTGRLREDVTGALLSDAQADEQAATAVAADLAAAHERALADARALRAQASAEREQARNGARMRHAVESARQLDAAIATGERERAALHAADVDATRAATMRDHLVEIGQQLATVLNGPRKPPPLAADHWSRQRPVKPVAPTDPVAQARRQLASDQASEASARRQLLNTAGAVGRLHRERARMVRRRTAWLVALPVLAVVMALIGYGGTLVGLGFLWGVIAVQMVRRVRQVEREITDARASIPALAAIHDARVVDLAAAETALYVLGELPVPGGEASVEEEDRSAVIAHAERHFPYA